MISSWFWWLAVYYKHQIFHITLTAIVSKSIKMRKKIPAAIIIFASLSSIIIFAISAALTYMVYLSIITIPFFVFWIITTTSLIRLKNWARIAYTIIHLILASFAFMMCLFYYFSSYSSPVRLLIFLLAFSYFLIAYIYFLRSNTVKLFKEWIVNLITR